MKTTSLLGLILVLAAAPAQAQSKLARVKAGLPAADARRLEQTIASAKAKGLPAEPLIDKALEGVAKGIAPSVIINAVRQRADLLARADGALRPYGPPSAAELTAGADVLQRGLSVDVVKRVRAGRREGEPIGVSLHTIADLVDRDVPANVALDLLNSWRHGRARTEDLQQMPGYVERLIRGGSSPSAAARSVGNAFLQGRKPPVSPQRSLETTDDDAATDRSVTAASGAAATGDRAATGGKRAATPPRKTPGKGKN